MSKTIDRVRQLREELNEEIAAVERRISQCRERKALLESRGLIPEDEALARFERDLDEMARKGRATLERLAKAYSTTTVSSYSSLSHIIDIHKLPNGLPNNPAPVFVHLARDEILSEVSEIIGQVLRDEKNEHRQVPAEDERRAELRKVEEELENLKVERDELQDELSRSFNFEPSEATQNRERREREQREIDILNKPIEERNKRNTPPEPSPSPVTVRDAEGRDVDDPGHGPTVRRSA